MEFWLVKVSLMYMFISYQGKMPTMKTGFGGIRKLNSFDFYCECLDRRKKPVFDTLRKDQNCMLKAKLINSKLKGVHEHFYTNRK